MYAEFWVTRGGTGGFTGNEMLGLDFLSKTPLTGGNLTLLSLSRTKEMSAFVTFSVVAV